MTRRAYPTDLTDKQWENLRPLVPDAKWGGRPRQVNLREVINAILYLLRAGCQWEMLPHDLPPPGTVYWYFQQWRDDGTWQRMHDALRNDVREAAGRDHSPSAAILDSQSVKTTETGGPRGYDAGKKVNGRKRNVLVDTLGMMLAVVVAPADIQDDDGGWMTLDRAAGRFWRLSLIWADSKYAGTLVEVARQVYHWTLEIVKRAPEARGFVVQAHRWIIERTFGWLGRSRRLSKDYEGYPESSEALIQVSMIHLMLRRLQPT
jgi:putative transposase